MLRLLPVLAFALLPAAIAAPVPPAAGRPTFGANGLLTCAELEKVKFEPRPANQKFRLQLNMAAPGKEFAKAAIAVHLPWNTFREGEVVPAYFVIKNGSDRDLPLNGRLDMYGPNASARDACAVGVFDRKDGQSVSVVTHTNWGERLPLVVPANDFYCVRSDVGHTIDGNPLPPGEYEVEWTCSGLYSAPVRFTITRRDDGAKPGSIGKRERVHFYRLTPERDKEQRSVKAGEPFLWSASRLDRVYAGDLHAALAVGIGGVYVPDLYAIPESDRLVRASVDWKRYREGERVAVTLTSVDPKKRVRFAERPHLHLHFRATEFGGLQDPPEEAPADAKAHSGEAFITPLTIEAKLPPNWLEWSGVHSDARVAVLVTSREVVIPRFRNRVQQLKKIPVRLADFPEWEGVLLTSFSQPRFPPPVTLPPRNLAPIAPLPPIAP